MRIVSFLAPTSRQAMADLRASLGEDAIILTTQTLDDGQVSVTGAAADDAFDLADVLEPTQEPRSLEWLGILAGFHEWPFKMRERIEPILRDVTPSDPEIILKTLVQALFRFRRLHPGNEKPLMFSGPPGGGKTVTIAKLAAAQVLAGHTVDVLTLDVKRAGGLDQLDTLLAPLDLKPLAVPTSADLPNVMTECKGDVILVDSPSTNPFNPIDLGAVSTLVARAGAELVLVLPAGQGYADSLEIARSYVALGARAMVVTKLDAARRFGGVLAAAESGLAFTEAGIRSHHRRWPVLPDCRRHGEASVPSISKFDRRGGRPMKRLLAVASGKGGVGKTWFSISLAQAFARKGRRVLLVDCDVGLANVDVQLGLNRAADLTHVVTGEIPLHRAIRSVDGVGFDVLPGRSGSGYLDGLDSLMVGWM